tara:strand:- start:4309 stop:4797 length:489 start_codon:yes stop_codon:yes gene_type:complete
LKRQIIYAGEQAKIALIRENPVYVSNNEQKFRLNDYQSSLMGGVKYVTSSTMHYFLSKYINTHSNPNEFLEKFLTDENGKCFIEIKEYPRIKIRLSHAVRKYSRTRPFLKDGVSNLLEAGLSHEDIRISEDMCLSLSAYVNKRALMLALENEKRKKAAMESS